VKPGATIDHPLVGSKNYTPEYWQTLVRDYQLSEATAKHLSQKFGTNAEDVMALTKVDLALRQPLVPGFAPLRAEVAYCARFEMAMTIEDVLMRRTGLQFLSWEAAIRAAVPTGTILAKELGWSAVTEATAIEQYQNKIHRLMQLAGLTANA
jgi:glycerol-3-phosphate dehydrogenase